MTIEDTRESAYKNIKQQLDRVFSKGGIPNLKDFKKIINDLHKRIKTIENGALMFANTLDEVRKAELAIANLQGQYDAYKERYNIFMKRIKENERL